MKIDRRQPLTMKEVEARRALVRKHMCDFMKSVTRNKEFNDPDEWIGSNGRAAHDRRRGLPEEVPSSVHLKPYRMRPRPG